MKTIPAITFGLLSLLLTAAGLAGETTAPLRLLAYNIKHARGMDGVVDVERIAKVIEKQNPDLVALQEVDKNCTRSNNQDIAKILGERLGMKHRFGKTINLGKGEYGNAVLSRLPIVETHLHKLPKSGEARAALEVVVEWHGKRLSFVSLHLERNSGDGRNAQVQALLEAFGPRDHPVILAGDFNAARWSRPMKRFAEAGWTVLEKNDGKDTRTIHGEKNRKDSATPERVEIDFLVVRGLPIAKFTHGVIPELMASDHRPIYATIVPVPKDPS